MWGKILIAVGIAAAEKFIGFVKDRPSKKDKEDEAEFRRRYPDYEDYVREKREKERKKFHEELEKERLEREAKGTNFSKGDTG